MKSSGNDRQGIEPKPSDAETTLERIARSQSKEFRALQRQVEEAADHPSKKMLRDYILDIMSEGENRKVLEHISLCSKCAKEVLQISWQEEEATVALPSRSLLEKLKGFISRFSFPLYLQFPSLEVARRSVQTDSPISCKIDSLVSLSLEAPGDGHIALFDYCEETGEVNLIFPHQSGEDTRVMSGQDVVGFATGCISGPAGKHTLKCVWTRPQLLDPELINFNDESDVRGAIEDFLNSLNSLSSEDWRVAVLEYEVCR